MAVHFLTPKTLCSLITAGSACAGGGIIYYHQLPSTWRELLTKEGYVFLQGEYQYKGMFNDQKDTAHWKEENGLKDAKDADVNDKASTYCASKLDSPISSVDYYSLRKKLISFCTIDGIVTVKARLIQSQKTGWIENDDDKYKAVFAVYRYDATFLEWLKGDAPENSSLSTNSSVDEYTKLKSACDQLLSRPHASIEGHHHFNYASWWCVELGHTTIRERITSVDNTWTQETSGTNIKNRWQHTGAVKDKVKTDQGKTEDPTDDDYKSWCDTQLSKQLTENDLYQGTYIMVKSVCQQ